MKKIIALSGWKGSGKDTVAEYLIKEHEFQRFAFADVLKEMVSEQYDVPLEYFHLPSLKEDPLLQYPVNPTDKFSELISSFMKGEFANTEGGNQYWTPRALCILEGSIKRSVNSVYWVSRVVKYINESDKQNFVITDLRYLSEARALNDAYGGELLSTVRINRFSESPSSDPSERDLDNYDFDYYIDNTRTLEYLQRQVDTIAYLSKISFDKK